MGTSRRSGWRGAVGALAMLAIVASLLVGTATVAEASSVNSVKDLKSACTKAGGSYAQTTSGSAAICDVAGGKTVYCNNKQKGKSKCQVVETIKARVVPQDSVRAPNGVELTTQTVPDSQVWNQNLSIPALTDVVCPSLGGDFVASVDATIGACGTPTATIICNDSGGTNCVGIAGTEKQAKSIPKQIKTEVGSAGTMPTAPTTTPPTTSPKAPPTTRKCLGRRCPPPTLPPGKAPGSTVPVAPPK